MVKYIDEYRDPQISNSIARSIKKIMPDSAINLMEVCGGHTITIFKYGIQKLLPDNLNLISGPGCPVCVTSNDFIDRAIAISYLDNVIITTFGDMIRVPGSDSSLLKEKASSADIRICYSPMDAVDIAKNNPDREIVFLGIGFETTAPTVAASILTAKSKSLNNFSVLSSHKTMPEAMKALLDSGEVALDGFICPGHVSTITGIGMYEFIARDYKMPCVVSGFEPVDMLETIFMLIKQITEECSEVENQYIRSVKPEGNTKAVKLMNEVFESTDMPWRGLGVIPGSGLKIRDKFQKFDAYKK
ncbi:MAG: hydrogenase formation protein HypD, partial [Candidatus Marinimicrobia bacterium]|nr:hydrogenase formation protein HypD [Candidatus Neomarinimicrobiota bacterium]